MLAGVFRRIKEAVKHYFCSGNSVNDTLPHTLEHFLSEFYQILPDIWQRLKNVICYHRLPPAPSQQKRRRVARSEAMHVRKNHTRSGA